MPALAKLLPLAVLAAGGALLIGGGGGADGDDLPPGGVDDQPDPGEPTAEGHMVHIIRYGDLPYYMAEYYTGMGSRFREFDAINPAILPFRNGAYAGWVPGQTILIPAAWRPFEKALPAPASGGTAPADDPPYDANEAWQDYLDAMEAAADGTGERVPEGPDYQQDEPLYW
jgi:hypothetical protein